MIASQWWTGPLIASSGQTTPKGHWSFEPYGFYTVYPEHYKNFEPQAVIGRGLTNFLDVQVGIPYDFSWDQKKFGQGLSDISLSFGLQVFKQNNRKWHPDFRVVVQELFPAGRYQNLDPTLLGTDQTGGGSYQTSLALNFQYTTEFKNDHYLRTRLAFVGANSNIVKVNGVNAYGGTTTTHGRVNPGHSYSADLAFEYALTKNWVPVFEIIYVTSSPSIFTGDPGIFTLQSGSIIGTSGGNPGFTAGGAIGGGGVTQVSMAPAIEYNFSNNLGIIGGVWFSTSGPAAAQYKSFVIAISYSL